MTAVHKLILALTFSVVAGDGYNPGKHVKPSDESCRCGTVNVGLSAVRTRTLSPLLFPWMVALIDKHSNPFCGGVLINNQEVLTAARCLQGKSPSSVKVILGVHDLSRAKEHDRYPIDKIDIHENFRTNTDGGFTSYENDIALVHIVQKVQYVPHILPICLFDETLLVGTDGQETVVLGWGAQTTDGRRVKPVLQMLNRPLRKLDECGLTWKKTFDSNKVICMGEEVHNICDGDYGGPLQLSDQLNDKVSLIGIASASGPTCGDVLPGLYTKFEGFRSWVKTKSKIYSDCYK